MAINVDRLLQRHIDRWVFLLGLGGWRITWDVSDGPIDDDRPVAQNEYRRRRSGGRVAHIRFDREQLRSTAQIESAVIHELLHLFDLGVGNDAHKLIYRLERPLRLARKRMSRAA